MASAAASLSRLLQSLFAKLGKLAMDISPMALLDKYDGVLRDIIVGL